MSGYKSKSPLHFILLFPHRVAGKVHALKCIYYRLILRSCGRELVFYGSCNIKNPSNISVGHNVSINDGAYLNGLGGIKIGNNVAISANAILVSTGLDPTTICREKRHLNEKIVIGNNVQVGAGAIVLPGVTIGDNVIVGAGSVVTKDVQGNCIVAGNPARLLRKICPEELRVTCVPFEY